MAKTITYTDLQTPTNLAGNAVAGGNMPVGIFYYVVVACFATAALDYYLGKSLASNEINVTTTSNNKSVTLTWNMPKGVAGSYRVFRATSSGAYLFSLEVSSALNDSVCNNNGVCTFTDTYATTTWSNSFYQNISHGKLILNGSTYGDASTMFGIVDLYNASVAGGWGVVNKLDNTTYRVNAYIVGHTNLYWIDLEKTIIVSDNWFAGDGSTYTFGAIIGSDNTSNGCHIIFKNYVINYFYAGILNAYKTTFEAMSETPDIPSSPGAIAYILIYAGLIQDCQVNKVRSIIPLGGAACTFKNVIYTGYDNAFSYYSGNYMNVTMLYGSRPFQTNGNSIIRVANLVSIGHWCIVLILGTNNSLTLVNSNITGLMGYPIGDVSGTIINELFTYNLKVIQNDSITPIQGATVKIYDVNNNLLYSGITNATGDIAQQELPYRITTYSGSTPTVINPLPLKLVISKTGYDDYVEFTDYTGSYALNKTVALTPYTPPTYVTEDIFGEADEESLNGDVAVDVGFEGILEEVEIYGEILEEEITG
jgi:hypothetical protein